MIVWTLPTPAPHLGLCVRVGQRGPVVPMRRGAVLVADQAQPGEHMQVRYPRTAGALSVRLSLRDLARVAPRGGRVRLYATVYHAQGTAEHTLSVTVDVEPPDGLVFALVTADGTYLTSEGLDGGLPLRVECEDGRSYLATSPGPGEVVFAEGERARPARVFASDGEGQHSGDLLAGVDTEPDLPEDATTLSAWPLPPYLSPTQPNLAAFLGAAESVFDVRPELAGSYLNPVTSSGAPLTLLGGLFGVTRTEAPTDAEVTRRILATLTPNKASRAGLETMLRAYGVFGGRVEDVMGLTGGRPLTLDGSWQLDGRYNLDGGTPGWSIEAGEVIAVFRRVPVAGLGLALRVMRRYKAAGIHARVMLRQEGHAEGPQPGTRATVRRRARLHMRVHTPFLVLDGTWQLDGTEELDGVRNGQPMEAEGTA